MKICFFFFCITASLYDVNLMITSIQHICLRNAIEKIAEFSSLMRLHAVIVTKFCLGILLESPEKMSPLQSILHFSSLLSHNVKWVRPVYIHMERKIAVMSVSQESIGASHTCDT